MAHAECFAEEISLVLISPGRNERKINFSVPNEMKFQFNWCKSRVSFLRQISSSLWSPFSTTSSWARFVRWRNEQMATAAAAVTLMTMTNSYFKMKAKKSHTWTWWSEMKPKTGKFHFFPLTFHLAHLSSSLTFWKCLLKKNITVSHCTPAIVIYFTLTIFQ